MPLGLWKSKWEIHREDMKRYFAELDRRHAEWREERGRSEERFREERARSEQWWTEFREESRAQHAELLARLDRNERNIVAMLQTMIDELRAVRREVREATDAVSAGTEAIFKLIDRFDEFEGRPPGRAA
jgi:hypothetical protein